MAIEGCSLEAFQERASLFDRDVLAERVVLQLTGFVERLPDRLRDVVEHADHVDRGLDDGRRLFSETVSDPLPLIRRQRVASSSCERMARSCATPPSGPPRGQPGRIGVRRIQGANKTAVRGGVLHDKIPAHIRPY